MKLIDLGEQKMVNAIMFFSKKVKYPFKLKMFKLLHYLDFFHFVEAGRPVTNQKYKAFEKGPVPDALYQQMASNGFSDYFKERIKPVSRPDIGEGVVEFKVKKGKKPDLNVFSAREKRILEKVAEMFRDLNADDMSNCSHLENKPWDITVKEKGYYGYIDYMLALLDSNAKITKELAAERLKDHEEIIRLFG